MWTNKSISKSWASLLGIHLFFWQIKKIHPPTVWHRQEKTLANWQVWKIKSSWMPNCWRLFFLDLLKKDGCQVEMLLLVHLNVAQLSKPNKNFSISPFLVTGEELAATGRRGMERERRGNEGRLKTSSRVCVWAVCVRWDA